MASTEQQDKLRKYLLDQMARRSRMDETPYRNSVTDSIERAADSDSRNNLAALFASAAAQAGTIGGKQADASPVAAFADRQNKANAAYRNEMAAQDEQREKRYGVDAKVYEYLADKESKQNEDDATAEYRKKSLDQAMQIAANKEKLDRDQMAQQERLKKAELANSTEKEVKDPQLQAAGFGKRAVAAAQIADSLIKGGYDPTTAGAQARSMVPGLNKWTMNAQDKQMDQAQRDFISAVLRKESGSAIPDNEIESERIKYFPQPNDDAQTLANKAASRQRAIETLKAQAGRAWDKVSDVAAIKAGPATGDGTAMAGPGEKKLEDMTDAELEAYIKAGGR